MNDFNFVFRSKCDRRQSVTRLFERFLLENTAVGLSTTAPALTTGPFSRRILFTCLTHSALLRAEYTVTRITKTGHDVTVIIKMGVNGCSNNGYIRVRLVEGFDTFGR